MAETISSKRIKDFLITAVEVPSITPNEQEMANLYEEELISRGFQVERQTIDDSGRANLFATKGEGARVLFYGHMDTVPVVNEDEWNSDPFNVHEEEGRLYGLGTSDMKGGTVAFIEAATHSETPVKIFLAVDEEGISEGAWRSVQEKADFFDGIDLVISAEPSFGLGLNGVTVGRTGRCVYEVQFKGSPEHIIKYKEAIDAFEKQGNFAYALYKNREEMFESPDTVVQVRKVSGESKGMSVCGEVDVEIETILGAEDTVETVREKLQELTDDEVRLKPRKTPYLEGYLFENFPYSEELSEIIKTHTGAEMTLQTRKSVGDDNVLASLKIPVITWGPVGDNEHAPNEYVELDSLVSLSEMYNEFLDSVGGKNG